MIVGSAEIVVRAIVTQVKREIEDAFKKARPVAAREGAAAGREYSRGFRSTLNLNDPIKRELEKARLTAVTSGVTAGKDFSRGFRNSIDEVGRDAGRAGEEGGREFSANMERAIERGTTRIESSTSRGLSRAGRSSGSAFSRALESEFAKGAIRASGQLTQLIGVGNLIGPAIGSAVSAVSALVSGLFALGSAVGQAAGALAVLPGALSVAAQAMGTLKLAFSGVGGAIGQGFKQASTGAASAGKAATSNAAAVASARKALARAYQSASDSMADANRRVADAERGVRDAQADVLRTQRALTAARREAAEELQQLAFSAEDAALAEQRAGLDLQDAYTAFQKVKNLPADNRQRQEAELSYKEAELAYREAKDRNSDLQKEEKAAAKAGVEGSKTVVDAKNDINDAEKKLADQRRALTEAQIARDRARRDSAQAIADAQDRLNQAMREGNAATAGGVKAADAYQTALDGLSPAAQRFVRYLVSLKGEFRSLKAAAGERLFPQLEVGLKSIVANLFPPFKNAIRDTGGLLGNMAKTFALTISRGEGLRNLKAVFKGNNDILAVFNQRTETGRSTIGNLAIMLTRVLRAIQPLTKRFAQWIANVIAAKTAVYDTAGGVDRLTGKFNKAGDRAALLGDIFGNLWQAIKTIGGAASESGVSLLESFRDATDELNKFLTKPGQNDKMKSYFDDVAYNVRQIGTLLVDVGREFIQLGDNRGVGDLAKSLRPAVKLFGQIGDQLTTAGPALGPFATQMARIVLALSQSDGIKIFINTLTRIAKVFADIVSNPVVGKILGIATAATAVTRAISFAFKPISFFFKGLAGGPIAAARAFNKFKRGLAGFKTGGIKGAFTAMRKGSDEAKDALERQMVTDREKIRVLKALEIQAENTGQALGLMRDTADATPAGDRSNLKDAVEPAASPAVGAAGSIDVISPDVERNATKRTGRIGGAFKALGKPLGAVKTGFKSLGAGILGLTGGPLGLLITLLPVLVVAFKKLYDSSPAFRKFVDTIVQKFGVFAKFIGDVFQKYVLPAINSFFTFLNANMPKAIAWFSTNILPVLKQLGSFFLDVFTGVVVPAVKGLVNIVITLMPIISKIIGVVFNVIKFYITKIFIPFWTLIFKAVRGLFNVVAVVMPVIGKIIGVAFNIIKTIVQAVFFPIWNLLSNAFRGLVVVVRFVFTVVKTLIGALFNGIKFIINKVFLPIWRGVLWPVITGIIAVARRAFNFVKSAFAEVGQRISTIVNRVIKPVFAALRAAFGLVRDRVATIVSSIKKKFNELRDGVAGVINTLRDKIDSLKSKFASIGTAVASAFTGLGGKAAAGINKFIDFLNSKFIGPVNSVTKLFNLKIPGIPRIKGYEEGGWTGPGPGNKVAGVVHADEYVIPKTARRAIEKQNPGALEYMRKHKAIPQSMVPMGDFGPFGAIASSVGAAAKGGWNSIQNIAKAGVGNVLFRLATGAKGALSAAGIKRGPFLNDLIYGIMDKLASSMKAWGAAHQEEAKKKAAPKGASVYVPDPSNPTGRAVWKGGTFTNRFIAHLIKAQKLSGVSIQVIQGGFRPATSYSGTSHQGDAIDSQVSYALLKALRAVGIASGDRTGLGNWGPHMHSVPGPGAGYGAGSAVWQFQDYMARGGARQSPRSPWGLAKGGVAIARPGGILANIAEAGSNERVEPLDRDGMSKRDKFMLDLVQKALTANGSGGDQFHVHPAPGMNEAELAQKVSARVSFKRSTGT